MQIASRTSGGGLVAVVVTNGGSGYTAPPAVVVGGGTGAVLYSQLAGTAVGAVVIQSAGLGYAALTGATFSGGGGTGAAASAYGYTGSLRPISLFRGRYNDVYGVDGMGRGIRWDGAATSATPIGLVGPSAAPAITASSTSAANSVRAVQILSEGNGYHAPPTVAFTGGTPSRPAAARATITGGRVSQITVTDPGAGYSTPPSVTISGGLGSGASFDVAVLGSVAGIDIVNPGYGFATTSYPEADFGGAVQEAYVRFTVNPQGQLDSPNVLSGGTGAVGPVSADLSLWPSGDGAVLAVRMRFSVAGVTVANSGSMYYSPPVLTFRPDPADPEGGGAAATASVDADGHITAVTVYAGGRYQLPPTLVIEDSAAVAQAEIRKPLFGSYRCCYRYIDSTPSTQGGPRASSISPLREVDCADGRDGLQWSITHGTIDSRVTAMELWRTTADQSVLLFRVATVPRDGQHWSSYTDSLSDDDLRDPDRAGYALMPVTLPSGQINARRFSPPPASFAVACMFQDRAWYAVDTTGLRPNSLLFSEVDEPESVPDANELVIQENTGDPDKVVALVPLGAYLLVAQQSHLYRLSYVAQPVIDASLVLAGYRGALNSRCWCVMGGVAFIADSVGLYAFDGNSEEALSVAVDNYWRDRIIDFSKSDKFHVQADQPSRVVRFFYCKSSDSEPVRALCYSVATKAWWEETFAAAVTANCPAMRAGRMEPIVLDAGGEIRTQAASSPEAVPYSIRTGPLQLVNERGSRQIGILYDPTTNDSTLNLRLHYNNSPTPRANAVASDTGTGFTTQAGATAAQLNLKRSRSALGDATGSATARYAGRVAPDSSGGDKHIAVALDGTQGSADLIRIHSISLEGAT